MASKRVLSISTLYPNTHLPRFGTFVARSLEGLAEHENWDVTVINPIGVPPIAFGKYKPLAAAAQDSAENGVQIFRPKFTLIPSVGARINPGVIARKILPLAQQLHAENPFDLVDAQFFYPDGPAAAWLAQQLDLPCTILARGSDISYWGTKDFAADQMLDAADRATGLRAVSKALASEMAALGMAESKISVQYTGLDRDRFRPLNHAGMRRALGQSLGITLAEHKPLLATVGNLIALKGQDLTMGAVASIPDAQLLIVGRGSDEAHLRSLAKDMQIEDRVHFVGSVDHDMLPIILSAADAMVLPSASEGLANVWVEALACGTPLVITDVGGARELVTSDQAGVLVDRTPESIAQGIRRILANPPDPQEVTSAVSHFSWRENARTLSEHFTEVIAKAKS